MPELFWQYPVITEKVFSLQNTDNESYVAMPWATIIDKRIDLNKIKAALQLKTERNRFNITCCQHIYFKKLIPFFKEIGINVLYTPHKVLDEDVIDGIIIKPCPLYAVNVEDERKNDCFKNINYMNRERRILYSFQGAYQEIYISKIRLEILKLQSGSGMGPIITICLLIRRSACAPAAVARTRSDSGKRWPQARYLYYCQTSSIFHTIRCGIER